MKFKGKNPLLNLSSVSSLSAARASARVSTYSPSVQQFFKANEHTSMSISLFISFVFLTKRNNYVTF